METSEPRSPAELGEALRSATAKDRTIELGGCFTKRLMGGPACPADVKISTSGFDEVLRYEPHDLTISVGAGGKWARLESLLAENRQMIPLDPPFRDSATVGGVIASNSSGPRRRLYGTARDMVIGMTFVTPEGKVVESGGMVVKNVAGLDMAKLMIGSFGTLAAMTVINFKLTPVPAATRTFVSMFDTPGEAIAARDRILGGVLQPAAVDLASPAASKLLGRDGWLLLVQAGGNAKVLDRYTRELAPAGPVEDADESRLWTAVREFAPAWMAAHSSGAVVRCSCLLAQVGEVLASFPGPAIARAGSGVCYGCCNGAEAAAVWMKDAVAGGWKPVIEFCAAPDKQGLDLWPVPGPDLAIMERVKTLFDPKRLLNRGRMYGRF